MQRLRCVAQNYAWGRRADEGSAVARLAAANAAQAGGAAQVRASQPEALLCAFGGAACAPAFPSAGPVQRCAGCSVDLARSI